MLFFVSVFATLLSAFLVQIKDPLVLLDLAVLACRKRWVYASFLGEASSSLTCIFPVGKTQRLLDYYYCGN